MTSSEPTTYIDGAHAPTDGEAFEIIEAATEQSLGRTTGAGPDAVDRAVRSAAAAGPAWATTPPAERAALLDRFAGALRERGRHTARLVSRENGMPIALSKIANGFAPSAILNYYAGLARELAEQPQDRRPSRVGSSIVVRKPVGTVAAIVPWNYPHGLAAMKLGPALAAGCTVVVKSSPETALDAIAFGEAATEAGLPDGVVNILSGGRQTGRHLVDHPLIDKVAFTGSTAAGRSIAEACGARLRPVTLELGGKSAAIVTEEADLEVLARHLPAVSFVNNGQTCHASTRILAPASRYQEVTEVVAGVAETLQVGDPLDPATAIGPLVSADQRERVLGMIARATDEGARIAVGGSRPRGLDRGWYVEPTVLVDVDNRSEVAREEVFGPVVGITPYADLDEAVELANDNAYGLAATVWSTDQDHGIDIARRLDTGTAGVNLYDLDVGAPFGGVKASGIGRELGPEGLDTYLVPQTIYTEG